MHLLLNVIDWRKELCLVIRTNLLEVLTGALMKTQVF